MTVLFHIVVIFLSTADDLAHQTELIGWLGRCVGSNMIFVNRLSQSSSL